MIKKILLILLFLVNSSLSWSATQLKKTVCPSGCDYTSLSACINANQQNLVTADKYFDIEISGDWTGSPDTTNVYVESYTMDATRYMNIYTTGLARHDGTASKATAYVLQGAADTTAAFQMGGGSTNITVDGIVMNLQGLNKPGFQENAGFANVYKNNVIYNSSSERVVGLHSGSTSYVYNNIIYGVNRCIEGNSSSSYAYNNTCYGAGTSSYGILRLIGVNNYAGNFDTQDYYSLTAGSDYNVSSDATGDDVGSNNSINKTSYTDYFTDIGSGTEDFHLKTASYLIGIGTSSISSTFTTDIDGETRSSWDVGADEMAAFSQFIIFN